MIMKKILHLVFAVCGTCLLPLITSCDDEVGPFFWGVIQLEPEQSYSISKGSGVTWTSDNPDVATVNDEAIVTGVSAGTAVISSSLGSFTAKVAFKSVSVAVDSIYVIANGQGATWTSGDPRIAQVEDSAKVVGVCAGTTELTSSLGTIVVHVATSYALYDEPYLKWGAKEPAVRCAMLPDTPYVADDAQLAYYNIGHIAELDYQLGDSLLNQVNLVIPEETLTIDVIKKHLANRYTYLGVAVDSYIYVSPTEETAVFLSEQNDLDAPLFLVKYMPYSSAIKRLLQ
jgi:hypothetical protein